MQQQQQQPKYERKRQDCKYGLHILIEKMRKQPTSEREEDEEEDSEGREENVNEQVRERERENRASAAR